MQGSATASVKEGIPIAARTPRVVVVDDSPDFLALMTDLIGSRASVICFNSPETTPDELMLAAPDLLIIDLRLGTPHDGWNLILAARGDERLIGVPLVVCSADLYGVQKHEQELLAMPLVHVLSKPFDLETFESLLTQVLPRSGQVGSADESPRLSDAC